MKKIIYEETLPIDIQERIKDLKIEYLKKRDGNSNLLDVMIDELYGSINSSQHGFEISKETADYLREKYIFNFQEERVFNNEL